MRKSLRALMVVAAVAMAGSVFAQAAPAPTVEFPVCWPKEIGGSGTSVMHESLQTADGAIKGQFWGWWCKLPDGKVQPWLAVHRNEYAYNLPSHDPTLPLIDKVRLYWAENAKPFDATTQPLADLAMARLQAIKPVASQYVVTQLIAGIPKTPTYTVVNNALVWNAERADSGAACDCQTQKVEIKGLTYCRIPGRTVVAQCKVR